MNERIEWFLEKATEIGIHEITPIICDHSERKIYKTDRAEKNYSICLKTIQSILFTKINAPIPFSQFIKQKFSGQKFIAHCEET